MCAGCGKKEGRYGKMTVAELKDALKNKGITGYSKLKKDELIALLEKPKKGEKKVEKPKKSEKEAKKGEKKVKPKKSEKVEKPKKRKAEKEAKKPKEEGAFHVDPEAVERLDKLREYVRDNISSWPDDDHMSDEIVNTLLETLNDRRQEEEDEVMNLVSMKELIVVVSPWPSFVDPGESWILNHANEWVSDKMAIDLMKVLDSDKHGYAYDKKTKTLTLRSWEQESQKIARYHL